MKNYSMKETSMNTHMGNITIDNEVPSFGFSTIILWSLF